MPDQEINVNPEVKVDTPEPSSAELEARASGWVPKEEFAGEEHKWVDAGEFVRRGELFKKIDNQNKELKEVKTTLELLKQHNKKIEATEFKKAVDYLKAQKKEALVDGDPDKLIEIDEKLVLVREQQKAHEDAAVQDIKDEATTIHPEFQAWTDRNKWYVNDPAMKAYADVRGKQLAQSGKAPSEVLKEVERLVKEEFPQKFKNPNRDRAGSVEGVSTKGTSNKNEYQPSELERRVAKKFVKQGVFKTEADYYKQLEG